MKWRNQKVPTDRPDIRFLPDDSSDLGHEDGEHETQADHGGVHS